VVHVLSGGAPRSSQSSLLVAGHHDVPKLRLRSSSNSTAPLLSGLSPDLANETSKPGLPRGKVFPPYINNAPPLIDSVQIPSSFCSERHTHSAAYSELPEPVSARLRIPATSLSSYPAKRSCDPKCAARPRLLADLLQSVEVAKPFCSASGRPNNSAALACSFASARCQSACVNEGALSIESLCLFPARRFLRYRPAEARA